MIRLFETHHIRPVTELDGLWDFATLPGNEEDTGEYPYRLVVPGCWEQHSELATYRGRGVYRRMIRIDEAVSLRLAFKGVSHTAKVFFDGELITEHYNAYTAFTAKVRGVQPGLYELRVEADNSFGEASSLHVPNDYYTYGGLIRPVALEKIGDCYLEDIRFIPSCHESGWSGEITAAVCNDSPHARTVQLRGTLGQEILDFGSITLLPGPGKVTTVTRTFRFADVIPWSGSTPRLYELQLELMLPGVAEPFDDLVERVGFRVVEAREGAILLNGEPVFLKGFNRHEDHALAGPSLPLSLMVGDLELMKGMGANAVRTSHYPNDERFLDLCDEQGWLVWEENHARGLSIEQMRNPNFISQCEAVNHEMVTHHVNHPSIIIWAILNECASDTEEGREHYRRQLNQIRGLDSSRPLTFASHHREKEKCFDLADIVSVNVYPQWYTDEDPGELCDRARAWADELGGKGKPMIVSEFGADGYYGFRSPARVKGSEERQADILELNLAAYLKRPYLSGLFIWQFCDCRVTEATGWLLTRAMTKNSKGVVDEYRRPKLACDVVRKYYNGQ
ncbi:glycoside hydrolase family 2 protein [Paenibacillus sacheonensis]|uniref:Beta-glucuronidase n=1 Tax=Paenibacillus sacheonensis TaxID=742054 RepID=A0A7X5C0W6_9BACL|nr:glycoside hydrolase family 2 TIM barrel-domain containing protein [Paenibacillus sacheonensis]MBM7565873.1 beta-glucuronidase [Paenibacillus sacheonensis]NBC68809.1 beta-glucuronidase [Paenibacillus sacheonensis]